MVQQAYVPGVLVTDITKLTEGQWKQMRRHGIGGSDASKVLGVSPFVTRKELFWEKCGIPHQNPIKEENWIAKEIGHRLESLVIQVFEKKHPDWQVFLDKRMFFHPEYPWMLANLDGLVLNPHTKELFILEVKTTSVNGLDKWGKKNSNVIPIEYEVQGRHYMAVTGINGVIYICLGGNQEDGYRERWLMRDMEKEQALIEAEFDFWVNYVQKCIEPPYDMIESAKNVLKALDKHYLKKKELKEILEELHSNMEYVVQINNQIAEIKKQLQRMENAKDKALASVLDYLKGNEGIMQVSSNTKYCVTYQERELTSIKSDDLHRLRMEFPEVYEKYVSHTDAGFWKVKQVVS